MVISNADKIREYYQALLTKDQNYVGIFYAGVKTTSVFCIATCRARKPKFENVDFFTTFKAALDAGYRPCKICKPTENANETPIDVAKAITLITENPKTKVSDTILKKHQISPEMVRRWFKKHYGITFQTYQRMYRINQAFQELKVEKKVINTAYNTGYESLSGFGYTYKKIIKNTPLESIDQDIILINRLTTPLGPMFVCSTNQGICLLEFVDRRMLETEFEQLQKQLKMKIIFGDNNHIKQTKKEIDEYFQGKRQHFNVKLHTPGTDFQKTVWDCLKQIPYGKLTTYKQQAEKINTPQAIRAVANANGFNRVAIIVPCHRVIGSNGELMGYGGGLERKRWLIEHEKKYSDKN
ncbi:MULTISPECIES: bifunctional transcriptional activator/DNA repair enzyme AdaA [unclassified Gilliamella]|uniref:bifunctional transcriptional activator/DNA repair enzyme AdaA n=1 Tax=unclassified Gilliamella TaxID=2685620 RepID=UPI00132BB80C|nr:MULTISPECIES: methylated-DNA--[protein]-cysteine S-methyltransferase [unclassified Gilliamella]MWN31117.1 methylated-DNA--[protein]-cysteine S-methyltransferase [Gilliamella sp. Pra-s60]MWP28318.1 methylated-DNA--[protein]-cysteine S-methyltransferase [Gilliamella sp. Pra-s54]